MKYSIIVPVYNVEKYLKNCLDSILSQTYKNFEVIVVNDGSPDNSQKIIDEYKKKDKRIKAYKKENGGISSARNFGIKKAKGDFLIFVDSDDSVNKELLEEINKVATHKIDIIRYQADKIIGDNHLVVKAESFDSISGEESFKKLLTNDLFVTVWTAAYNANYFRVNKFEFADGKIHEDFGVLPLIYVKAKNVTCIDYVGYNYYVREKSIMTTIDEEHLIKRYKDMLCHYDFLIKGIDKAKDISDDTRKLFKSYVANAMINVSTIMDGKNLDNYLSELQKRNVSDNMLDDSLGRKMKKTFFKMFPKSYISLYLKK